MTAATLGTRQPVSHSGQSTPRPKTVSKSGYVLPLATVRYHEWLDRAEDDHAALLGAVAAHAETLTHDDAVARIVGERPVGWEQSKRAAVFWEHHRDLYVYAALTRPGSVRALETRLRMGASTLYHRLGGWGVAFLSFLPPPPLPTPAGGAGTASRARPFY